MKNLQPDVRQKAVAALQHVANCVQQNPTAGQTKILVSFLAGLYDGRSYPFVLTALRELDLELCISCISILSYNCVRTEGEVHKWGVFQDKDLHRWMKREGISCCAAEA